MKVDIITIFPEIFENVFEASIIGRAQKQGLVDIKVHNLRKWAKDKYKSVDGKPFGGGPGMVMKIKVIDRALKDLRNKQSKVVLLTPQGKKFEQKLAEGFSNEDQLILLCGHYEGVDERVRQYLIDEEISIGDYVLTGGEIPAMVVVDSVVRLLPGVVGNKKSIIDESFSGEKRRLEYPQYTRPEDYKGWKVPKVLLNGNHKEIEAWREKESVKRTKNRRPDLVS